MENLPGTTPMYNVRVPLHITLATLTTITNSLVIFIYINMKKERKKISNYLMFAQALVDLYTAGITWFELVTEVLVRWNVSVSVYVLLTFYSGKRSVA